MNGRVLAFVLLLSSPAPLFSGTDTSYIKNTGFRNDLRLTNGFNSQYIDLYTTAVNPLGDHIYYVPNVKSNIRLALNYRFLSFSYGTQVANKLMSPEIFGTTEYNDLAFSWFLRRFGAEIYYRRYSGLYIPAKDYRSAVTRPDLALGLAGINFYFIGNGKKFSYRAAASQTVIQAKSAGAFILLLSSSYRTFAGSYSMLPPALDSSYYFGPIKGIMAVRYFISTLSPGYARNMVAKSGK